MTLQDRIQAFVKLGKRISTLSQDDFEDLARRVENGNSWFTPTSTKNALDALKVMMNEGSLQAWAAGYPIKDEPIAKVIGVLMAGNIPAVGFHDVMCVLISGHKMHGKLSTTDTALMKWLTDELVKIAPAFEPYVSYQDMLKGKDAYIATGSDNSARYFEYYFGKYPHIIRKNRTSVGVFTGEETAEDYLDLANDIFQYYGLGCRNISKIYINHVDQLQGFLDAIEPFNAMITHHKYRNNYDYNKSIYLVNQRPHLDNGFLLLTTDDHMVSPISVLYYEVYKDHDELMEKLAAQKEKIQCVVSKGGSLENSIPFGHAQCPAINDFADNVDTMKFLIGLYE